MFTHELWEAERAVIGAARQLAELLPYRLEPCEAITALQDAIRRLDDVQARADEFLWVERTWRDVRQGDVICPVGMPQHAARVDAIERHSPGTRRFTMLPLEPGGAPIVRNVSNPDGAICVRMTPLEVAAVEALGGWSARQGVMWDA